MAQGNEEQIKVRNVWASNLLSECDFIINSLGSYSFASIKCKNPLGSSVDLSDIRESAIIAYDLGKLQIGNLPIIQLGLTLFNSNQELPVIEGHPTIWLFNFNMSDSYYCPKILSETSLDRFKLRGFDLDVYRRDGVDPVVFRDIMLQLGFLQKVNTWISFRSFYNFGYLIKLFMDKNRFPETLKEFMEKENYFLGEALYDVQEMAQSVGLLGSLEKVREAMGVVRVAESEEGNVGFDSHLTMQVFMSLKMHHKFKDRIKSITE